MLATPFKKSQDIPTIKVEQLREQENKFLSKIPFKNTKIQEVANSRIQIFTLKNTQSQPSLSQKLPSNSFLPSASSQNKKQQIRNESANSKNEEKKQTQHKKQGQTILTAAQTLQNQYIANKIDIDLGSLPDFLDDDSTMTNVPCTNQKMKFKKIGKSPYSMKFDMSNSKKSISTPDGENQDKVFIIQEYIYHDDQDDEKEYDLKKTKYLNPIDALKNEEDEKKRQIAAKAIIQQLFRANYGDDIDKFEEQSAIDNYKLKTQDEILDQDNQITKFLKKNARKNLREKIKILQEQLDEQNNMYNLSLGNQYQSQSNQTVTIQTQKNNNNKQVKINDLQTEKKRKMQSLGGKDDETNNFENQDTSRNNDERKGSSFIQFKQGLNSLQTLNQSRNESQYHKNTKTKYFKETELSLFNQQQDNIFSISQQQPQNPQTLRNIFQISKNLYDYRFNYIMDFKFRHQDITALWLQYGCDNDNTRSQNDKLYKDYFEQQIKFYQMYFKRNKNYEYYKDRKKKVQFTDADYEEVQKEYQEYPREEVLIMDQSQITVWNQKIESTFMMFLTLNYNSFQQLQKVELYKTQLKEDGILILLETIQKECQFLKILNLSCNKIGIRALMVINKIILQFQLIVLGLKQVEMNTKQFCSLCISIAEHQTIQDLDISENLLDERALEGIKTIIRYIKNLSKLNISKNNIPEIKYKEIKKQMYDSLKNKEIIFF